ncbi:MAG TPA: hypothetical protein VJU61_28185 [Polyangiaceae bacterium]|nr:hypothetical protein [Polyangiaceae bacterium]
MAQTTQRIAPESGSDAPNPGDEVPASPPVVPAVPVEPVVPVVPVLLDDFEDGDEDPSDARFSTWAPSSSGSPQPTVDSSVEGPGFNSNFSAHLSWNLPGPADASTSDPGVALETLVAGTPLDLSAYTRVVLGHRYEPVGQCTPAEQLRILFGCAQATCMLSIPVSSTWVPVTLSFTDFSCPEGLSPATCLAVTNRVALGPLLELQNGECSSGFLHLDSISFR